jgi:Nickel responsive protein SCO4226-like
MREARLGAHDRSMNRYLIERNVPGAGKLTPDELHGLAATSNTAIATLDGRVQWVHSYVTDDAITCEYLAADEDAVREHGRCGGFPVDAVRRIGTVIDPMTGA